MNPATVPTGLESPRKAAAARKISDLATLAPKSSGSDDTKQVFLCVLFATLMTAWLTYASVHIESLHLANHGFFFDPATYHFQHIDLYRACINDGAWPTLLHELSSNSRCLLRTVPYLVAPSVLKSVFAHLYTEVPFLWSFLLLLTLTTYWRTKSVLLAVLPATCFSCLPYLYNPQSGLGAFWLDLTASLAMGSSVLCLIRFAETKHLRWILLFGLFASATALSRWSAASYLLLYAVAAVPLALVPRVRGDIQTQTHTVPQTQFGIGSVIKPLALALVTALPGLVFTFYWFKECTGYYAHSGYALNAPITDSFAWAFRTIQLQLSPIAAFILVSLSALHLVLAFRYRTSRQVTLISFWFPAAVLLFVCVICRAVEAFHALFYMAPALVVSAFAPISKVLAERHARALKVFAVALLVGSVALTSDAYKQQRRFASSVDQSSTIRKKADVAMANFIAQTQAPTFIEFDTQTIMPHLEAFYTHGIYCLHPHWFSVHPFHFTGLYPNKTLDQVAVRNYTDVARDVALVGVFHNPNDALTPGLFNNPYSAKVSAYISARVPKERQWRFLGSVETPNGLLDVYHNKDFRGIGL